MLRQREGGKYFDRYGFDFCGSAVEDAHPEDKAVTAITDDILGFIERSRGRPWFACAMHFTTHTRLRAPPALVEKHAEFHQTAGGVARQINSGHYDQAERLIGSGSVFARVSNEVATLLTQAKRGL